MTTRRTIKHVIISLAAWAMIAGVASSFSAFAQSAPAQQEPKESAYIVEWVYRVKWGYQDEFNKIFTKYQIAILNKEKEEGLVTKYIVQRPGLHTSEDNRWDLRVLIYYKDQASQAKGRTVARTLFPDQETFKKEEQRRWELTLVHWDLPIREVDPNAEQK